ncbi:EAL domain-containing protein [Alicyclobacillus vulcanalis]|uniref:EAL domain, c-di-GMP-specific phosphodiesterase class I (Or its enzymatically inactive variant) n=1 Tax=Alicyclobacillus vulcanalis TaxID=252246 RepID=A0A1N7NYM8_9BACL|nr:EAL domain-containing protein [Alicyclobacillus vulcanalis]SIT03396.1 EAL domain, c-di-GMP-specific phosphodiesterase class I (or its enzymatically inactive variant) [Alicyclobacillus vulcanalis]
MECPGCSVSQGGIRLQVGPADAEGVRRSLASARSVHWSDDTTVHMPPDVFAARAAYWREVFDTRAWRVRSGEADGSGAPEQAFDAFVEGLPPVWIDELLARGAIRMAMQPIVDLTRGAIVACEMLVRAQAQDGSWISPGALFDAARDQARLFALDRACRIEAISSASRLPKDWDVFVNFIPTSIYVPEHCLRSTFAAADRHAVAHARLVFEVVETERVDDVEHLRAILSFYRRRGVRYALDDFGEGYSDERMLRALQPDVVKLDRRFVDHVAVDRDKQRVAEGLARVARSLGIKLLAEGVERPEDATKLLELGYTWQQGYLYARPTLEPPREPLGWLPGA